MNYDLLIDIGNTFSKIAFARDGGIYREERIDSWGLLSKIKNIIKKEGNAHIMAISDVRKIIRPQWHLENFCDRLILLDSYTEMPVVIDYQSPKTLGADRIAAAVGAHSIFPDDNCLIVDLGTAITIDYIDRNGKFSGGNISPGMSMRFQAMHSFTGSLPLVSPQDVKVVMGRNTEEAISNGVVLGIIFEIQKYINQYHNCKIIFTGGDALFFAKKLNFAIFVVYNLVLKGLLQVADFNDCEK